MSEYLCFIRALRPTRGPLASSVRRSPSRTSRLARGCLLSHRRIGTAAAVQDSPSARQVQGLPSEIPAQISQHDKKLGRRDTIKNAKPFSEFLTDNFHRQHDYLRISITERCNLRCLYCMPEEGVSLSPKAHLLTTPEIYYLSALFVSQGVTKIRLTGGEPTVRQDIVPMMRQIGSLRPRGLKELAITTNGISLHRKLDSMVEAGLTGVNLSLDTLDPFQFQIMTRRKGFDAVMRSIDRILEMNKLGAGIKLKVNCVVMRGLNDREIVDFVELGRGKDIEVRFIEYMPFDGNKWSEGKMFTYQEMLQRIREKYPTLRKVQDHKNDTSKTYEVPGLRGRVGFITSMTHNFCGTCNRLRITSDGNLKVCLFGNAEVSLRDILRKDNGGEPLDEAAFEAMKQIEMDRRQGLPGNEGALGLGGRERELLDVIGMAVKRKKEKHAGIGDLENMPNRPMILIDNIPLTRSTRILNTNPHIAIRNPRTPWSLVPSHPLSSPTTPLSLRSFSAKTSEGKERNSKRLTHINPNTSSAHMVSVTEKAVTRRVAIAAGHLQFRDPSVYALVRDNAMKKGDVLGAARIAGIMAAKRTSDLVPLCHPIGLTSVGVEAKAIPGEAEHGLGETAIGPHGGVLVEARVECEGKTGVEMEALTAASVALLTVYDMCKAVDKHMVIGGVEVVYKAGGKSGTWASHGWRSMVDGKTADELSRDHKYTVV